MHYQQFPALNGSLSGSLALFYLILYLRMYNVHCIGKFRLLAAPCDPAFYLLRGKRCQQSSQPL